MNWKNIQLTTCACQISRAFSIDCERRVAICFSAIYRRVRRAIQQYVRAGRLQRVMARIRIRDVKMCTIKRDNVMLSGQSTRQRQPKLAVSPRDEQLQRQFTGGRGTRYGFI